MIDRLDRLVEEIASLHGKLVLLIGAPGSGKTALLHAWGRTRGAAPLGVGSSLSSRLALLPQKQRGLQCNNILRELANTHATGDLLLLDNLEALFDRSLQLDPLAMLKGLARTWRVVAVWPGDLRDGRLIYAQNGHPEYQDYGVDAVVPFELR